MEPSVASSSVLFPTVQSGSYSSYNVLALGPCHKASEIFSRHSDSLCFGNFSGPNTVFVNFTPLGIASTKTQAPAFQQAGQWHTPWNSVTNSSAPSSAAQMMGTKTNYSIQSLPPSVPPTCSSQYTIDPTLAPSKTRLSYGTFFSMNANAGKSCNMTSFAGSCGATTK